MMEPNVNRNARNWHNFCLLLERMYKVARTGKISHFICVCRWLVSHRRWNNFNRFYFFIGWNIKLSKSG